MDVINVIYVKDEEKTNKQVTTTTLQNSISNIIDKLQEKHLIIKDNTKPPTNVKKTLYSDFASFDCTINNDPDKWPCNWQSIQNNKLKQFYKDNYYENGANRILDNINRGKLDKSQMPSEQQLKDLIESEKEYLAGLRQLINTKNTKITTTQKENVQKMLDNSDDGKGILHVQNEYDSLKNEIKQLSNGVSIGSDSGKFYDKDLYLKRNKDEVLLMLSSEKAKFAFLECSSNCFRNSYNYKF